MKLVYHNDREIESDAVDYGDGNVMIRYKDTGEITIVPKNEIKTQNK
jgi:hypothetical protein